MKLRSKLTALVSALLLMMTFSPALVLANCATPASTKEAIQCGSDSGAGSSNQNPSSLDTTVHDIINILSLVVGIAAIIMIIVSGLRYITSAGDAEKVKGAKRGLLYALVGLVIVALAQTIVHFVLTEATNPSNATTSSTQTGSGNSVSPGAANSPH